MAAKKTEGAGAAVGPGSVETLQPDQGELDRQSGAGNAVATRQTAELGKMGGAGGFSLKPSRMLVAYGVGWNAEGNFRPGSLVLDQTDLVAEAKAQVSCVIMRANRYWKTWFEKGMTAADVKTYPDEAAALAGGEITQWAPYGSNGPKPTAIEVCDFELLVRRPEGSASLKYPLKLAGAWWAPVRLSVDKKWKETKNDVFSMMSYEAGMRDAHPKDGRLDAYFARLWTETKKLQNGNTNVKVRFGFDPDPNGGGPLKVPDKLLADLRELADAAAEEPAEFEPEESGDFPS